MRAWASSAQRLPALALSSFGESRFSFYLRLFSSEAGHVALLSDYLALLAEFILLSFVGVHDEGDQCDDGEHEENL